MDNLPNIFYLSPEFYVTSLLGIIMLSILFLAFCFFAIHRLAYQPRFSSPKVQEVVWSKLEIENDDHQQDRQQLQEKVPAAACALGICWSNVH